jgi:hypothetical protein
MHLEIDIPKGDYFLRTGVYDIASNKAGTLGVPVADMDVKAVTQQATH